MVKIFIIPDPAKQYTKTPVVVEKTIDIVVKPEEVIQVPVDAEKPELGLKDEVVPAVWGKGTERVTLSKGEGETATVLKYSDLAAELEKETEISGVPKTDIVNQVDLAKVEMKGVWGLGCPTSCGRFWEFKPNDKLDSFVPLDDAAWKSHSPKVIEEADVDITPSEETPVETLGIGDEEFNPEVVGEGEAPLGEPPKERVYKHIYLIKYDDGRIDWVDAVPVTYGYLDWRILDNSPPFLAEFTCDKCGEKIRFQAP